jgi:shikimate dehydrogenase
MAWQVYHVDEIARTATLSPPARLAVFGDPVAHSRSPQLHNPALRACAIAAQYVRLHVAPAEFSTALARCRDAGYFGVNCTIPHKFAALEAVDETDPLARRLGAVNTIVFRSGTTLGFNSDGPGLLRAVVEEFGSPVRDLRVLILGAGGGAGRAAAIQCALEGCPRLTLVNRTREKIESLARSLGAIYPSSRLALQERPDPADADLIINATSVGMKPDDQLLIDPAAIEARHFVLDMIYSPPETPLVRVARTCGARAANGLSMLLHQGAVSFEHWFQRPAPLDEMRRGLMESFE